MDFTSDNIAGMSPKILAALTAATQGTAPAYGNDPWTAQAQAKIDETFECRAASFLAVAKPRQVYNYPPAAVITRRPIAGRAGRLLLTVVFLYGASIVVFGLSRSYPLSLAAMRTLSRSAPTASWLAWPSRS